MAARTRSPAQKRRRAFKTRSQGMIRKVKEMHHFTDAKTAVVGIANGKMFWYDEAGVLPQLGIAHEPQGGLKAQTSSGASSFSSAESVSSFAFDSDSPSSFTREEFSQPPELDCDTSVSSADAATFGVEDENLSTAETLAPPTRGKTPDFADIACLDLDFFGLEKDDEYGV